jgi:hypothetical protein
MAQTAPSTTWTLRVAPTQSAIVSETRHPHSKTVTLSVPAEPPRLRRRSATVPAFDFKTLAECTTKTSQHAPSPPHHSLPALDSRQESAGSSADSSRSSSPTGSRFRLRAFNSRKEPSYSTSRLHESCSVSMEVSALVPDSASRASSSINETKDLQEYALPRGGPSSAQVLPRVKSSPASPVRRPRQVLRQSPHPNEDAECALPPLCQVCHEQFSETLCEFDLPQESATSAEAPQTPGSIGQGFHAKQQIDIQLIMRAKAVARKTAMTSAATQAVSQSRRHVLCCLSCCCFEQDSGRRTAPYQPEPVASETVAFLEHCVAVLPGHVEYYRKLYRQYDADGDGAIDPLEVRNLPSTRPFVIHSWCLAAHCGAQGSQM